MWKQLIWKQWREQGWRMIYATTLMGAALLLAFRVRLFPDQVVVASAMALAGVALPIFVAAGLLAPQRGDGSHASMTALPVSANRLLAVHLLTATVMILLPLATSFVVVVLATGMREMDWYDVFAWHGGTAGAAWLLFVWTFAFSIRMGSEAQVAAVLGGCGLWAFVTEVYARDLVVLDWLSRLHPIRLLEAFTLDRAIPLSYWVCVGFHLAMLVLLGWHMSRGFAGGGRSGRAARSVDGGGDV